MALDIDVGSVLVNDEPSVTVAFDPSAPSVNDSLAIIHPPSVTFQEYADAMAKLNPVFAADESRSELQSIYDALKARGVDPAVHAAVVSFDIQAAGEAVNPPYRNVHGVMRYGPSSYEMVSYPSYLAAVQDWMRRVCPRFPTDACRGKTVEFIVKQQCFPPNCDSEVVLTRMREYVASLRASQSSP